MYKTLSSIIGLIILTFAFNAFTPLSVAAQMPENPSVADLEQFRNDFVTVTQELNVIAAEMKSHPLIKKAIGQPDSNLPQMTAEMQTQAQRQFQTMSYEDLATLYYVFRTKYPEWRDAPQVLRNVKKGGLNKISKDGQVTTSNAITPDDCQIAFNSQPSFIDLYAVKVSEIVAQAAYEAVPEVLNLIALAAWSPLAIGVAYAEYENSLYDRCSGDQADAALQTSITNISGDIIQRVDTNADYVIDRLTTVGNNFKADIVNNNNANKTMIVNNDNSNKTMILDAISNAQTTITNNGSSNLTTITTAVTNAKNEIVSNDNTNRTTIVNNDNSNATTLNTNLTSTRNAIIANNTTNTTNIVNNSNTNTANIINNSTANTTTLNTAITNAKTEIINNGNTNKTELRDLLLRSQIEANLAEEGSNKGVAWYLTPTANGGHLDLVQQIVTQTLANIQAAGGDIGNAQNYLTKANQEKAAGDFKKAYDYYGKAYRTAAK